MDRYICHNLVFVSSCDFGGLDWSGHCDGTFVVEAGAFAGSLFDFDFFLNRLLHFCLHNIELLQLALWFAFDVVKNAAALLLLLFSSFHGDPPDFSVPDGEHVVVKLLNRLVIRCNESLALLNGLCNRDISFFGPLLRSCDHSGDLVVFLDDPLSELLLVSFRLFSLLPLVQLKGALKDSLLLGHF